MTAPLFALPARDREAGSQLANALRDAEVPARWRTATRAAWQGAWPAPLDAWAARWNAQERGTGENVALLGPCGVGKTHLATALLVKALSEGDGCYLWLTASRYLELPDEPGADEPTTREWAERTDLLVLDDLGAEALTERNLQPLRRLIHMRYDDNLATIVTSNLTARQLIERDARMASRILSGVVVSLAGRDRRLAKGAAL